MTLRRSAVGALVALSLGLLAVGRLGGGGGLDEARMGVADAFAPVFDLLSRPLIAVRRLIDESGTFLALREENERLRGQIAQLLEWQRMAQDLARENEALREMVRAAPEVEAAPVVTARVVAVGGGAFVRSVLVNAGERDGVANGMAAVNGQGLVGRVVAVGHRSARVLLLTDLNARVPIQLEPSGDRAILQGDNGPEPRLKFLPLNPRVAAGDRVVTSGLGGLFPPGLPVGVVTAVGDDVARVAPYVDWGRLEYVRILDLPPPEMTVVAGEGVPPR
jgi:rod shape-determining protein MreC